MHTASELLNCARAGFEVGKHAGVDGCSLLQILSTAVQNQINAEEVIFGAAVELPVV